MSKRVEKRSDQAGYIRMWVVSLEANDDSFMARSQNKRNERRLFGNF